MKKLILFDLDGTLLDTLEDLSEAVNYALELRGLPLHTMDEYRGMVGHGVRNLVAQALDASVAISASASPAAEGNYFSGRCPKNQFSSASTMPTLTDAYIDSALADFKEYYQAHIDVHTHPYPGMPELLSDLQARGVQLAIASNKFQEGTEYLVQKLFPGIDFVAILGNRPGWPLKPSPEIVQEVLQRSGVSPEDALLVGDSPTDMRTAANGGIEALAVTWGYRTAEELSPVLCELFPDGTDPLTEYNFFVKDVSGNGPYSSSAVYADYQHFSDYWLESGSYLKCDNITIGYTWHFKDNNYVRSLRLYGTGQNLFTITSYSGLDPEINTSCIDYPGIDINNYYPKTGSFLFGVNLNLLDWLKQYSTDTNETFIRSWLGRMLFSGEEALKKADVLSGGERVRCMLAKTMLEQGNLLIFND